MTPRESIEKAMELLPVKMKSDAAALVMLAIHYQEDPEGLGYQKVKRTAATSKENTIPGEKKWAKGPARGWWQFEEGGGVKGVMRHPSTERLAREIIEKRWPNSDQHKVWAVLEDDHLIAAALARLLLWTDAGKLPAVGDCSGAFDLYLRVWRPGAYARGNAEQKESLRKKFQTNYLRALTDLSLPPVLV